MQPTPLLRPLGYRDIFDETFDLLKRNFLVLVGISAVTAIPFTLITAQFQAKMLAPQPGGTVPGPEQILSRALPMMLAAVVYIFAAFITQGALTRAIADRYLGRPTSIAGAYGYILRHFFPYLLTSILASIVATAGVLACYVGVFFTTMAMVFVTPAFVVEGQRYTDALSRSYNLVRGHMLRAFVILFLAWLVGFALRMIVETVWVTVFQEYILSAPLTLAHGLLSGVVGSVAGAVQAMPLILLYFDVRVRKEGFDIELLAHSMGQSS